MSELAFIERIDHALRSRIRVELSMRRGESLFALGDRERAQTVMTGGLETFAERLALGADDPFTRYYAAGTHALLGHREEALTFLVYTTEAIVSLTVGTATA